jgi:hypothetical protein
MLAVTWTGTSFVAVGSAIWTSTDGITWTQRVAGFSKTSPSFYGVSYFNSKAYVTGYNAKTKAAIMGTSSAPDGYSWNPFTILPGGNALISITKSGTKFVGVGWNGSVAVSADGTHWSVIKVPLAAGDYFTDVTASAAGAFVATTYDGAIWASTNGTSWTKRFYASHSLWCVTKTTNEFLAAGNYGTLVHSFDGIYWREEDLGTHTFINQIIEAGSQLIATGGYGAIFTSTGTAPVRPTVGFALSSATLAENASPLTVSVTMSEAWTLPVTVPLTFAGTASTTSDYTRSTTSLTFAPGETTKTITITPKNDTARELDETIVITLGAPTGDAVLAIPTMTITLTDDDAAPPPALAADRRVVGGGFSFQSDTSQNRAAAFSPAPTGPSAISIALQGLPDCFIGFAGDIEVRIDIAVTADGACTGKLTRDAVATPFTGQFITADGLITSTIDIGEEVLNATIHPGTGELTGTLTNDKASLPICGWKIASP